MATADVSNNPDIELDEIRVDFTDEQLRDNMIAIERSILKIGEILIAIDTRLKALE